MEFMAILNAVASILTIETGAISNMHEAADAISAGKMDRLSCRVDYEKVSRDMEPYYSALDDYTSKYIYEMNDTIISSNEREQFIDNMALRRASESRA